MVTRQTYRESAEERAGFEVCDSCIENAMENGAGDLEAEEAARDWGSDLSDHICEAREEGEPCGCACREHDEGGPRG